MLPGSKADFLKNRQTEYRDQAHTLTKGVITIRRSPGLGVQAYRTGARYAALGWHLPRKLWTLGAHRSSEHRYF